MAQRIYGREPEDAQIEAFIGDGAGGPIALLLVGDPGIGKTVLWEAAVARARTAGHVVLATRPAEAEQELPYAGLIDLFAEVPSAAIEDVPKLQRQALDAALLRGEAGTGTGQLAVSLGALAVLRTLSTSHPIVLAIDDLQWLDRPSARVLSFGLRRLGDRPVSLLASLRTRQTADALVVPSAIASERHRVVALGSLTAAALGRLLAERLGLAPSLPSIARLTQVSGGNPLHALELARELPADARLTLGAELPVPPTLSGLLTRRLAAVRRDAMRLAAAAAALARPTVEVLESFGPGLEEALEAEILELDGERVRFTHPLLASAAAQAFTPSERRVIHRQLADIVEDSVERALQRSLGTTGADGRVAAELEEAARVAAARGAPDTAAELAERSEQATPASHAEDGARRALIAATHHAHAGDGARARTILERLVPSLAAGNLRSRTLVLLAEWSEDIAGAPARLRQALREAGADPALRAKVHLTLANQGILSGTLRDAERNARAAERLAGAVGDPMLRGLALSHLGFIRFRRGQGVQRELAEVAIGLVDQARERGDDVGYAADGEPRIDLATQLLFADRFGEARALLEGELLRVERLGDIYRLATTLIPLVEVSVREGRWGDADRFAEELFQIGAQIRISNTQPAGLYVRALVDAHLGRVDEARARALQGREAAARGGDAIFLHANEWVLGLVEMSVGNADAAHRALSASAATIGQTGMAERFPLLLADAAEAAVAVGDLEVAEQQLEEAERLARQADRISALAAAARGRGLLEAELGDLAAAEAATDAALAEHARLEEPFERARTLLVRGTIQRRAGRRSAARATLTESRELFERLGAVEWTRRVATELGRVGGRRAAGNELTPTEQRVAVLVCDGKTNREVAAALFVTEKTVEANLSRIYRKIGVRSRTELAHRLSEVDGARGSDAPNHGDLPDAEGSVRT